MKLTEMVAALQAIQAVKRLQLNEPPEGYYVAFSGGKDSCVVLDLCKRAGVKFDAHFNVTTVDPPEVLRFVHEHHPEVVFERPEVPMWKTVAKKKILPTRIARYCCAIYKETGGKGRVVVTGIRREESPRRAKRHLTEPCRNKEGKSFIHPIIDWSTEEVWEYLHKFNLPYCSLYDEGFTRIGCVCCPFSKPRDRIKEKNRWPNIYRNQWEKGEDVAWRIREKEGMRNFPSPQAAMEWWMTERKQEEANLENLFGIMGDETMV